MSDLLNESVLPETAGTGTESVVAPVEPSADPEWDAAAAEAATIAPVETAEPVAAPPAAEVPPAAPSDFTHAVLESGEHEITLANGEVYRGKTELEVAQKIAVSKAAANRYIQELKQQPAPAAAAPAITPAASPSAPEIDPTYAAIAEMNAQGLGFKDAAELRAIIADFRSTTQQFTQTSQSQQEMAYAQQFVTANGADFYPSEKNGTVLGETMARFNLPLTMENLQLAHYAAKAQGLYEARPTATPATPNPRPAPLPPGGNAPSSSLTGSTGPSLADLEKMSLEDLEAIMDKAAA